MPLVLLWELLETGRSSATGCNEGLYWHQRYLALKKKVIQQIPGE